MTAAIPLQESLPRLGEQEVRREITQLFGSRSLRASRYGSSFASLWETTSECVGGGKLLRPSLLLGAFDALRADDGQGVSREAAVRIAAAVEILHYSFLLHDDVIDGDLRRRGRPNLIGALLAQRRRGRLGSDDAGHDAPDPRDLHWARTSGILMGDLLLSDAHRLFARERLPERMRARLLDLLDHTIAESVAGEYLDVELSDRIVEPDLTTVLDMTRLKTATYTFELPLKAAAILAGSSPATEEVLGEIGRRLGVAFQLQDDLLSTFGDPAEHGKDPFSDLREGKETAIVAHARMTPLWLDMEPLFGEPALTADDAMRLRRLLVRCGAETFVRSLIDDELRATTELLVSPESAVTEKFSVFALRLMDTIARRRS